MRLVSNWKEILLGASSVWLMYLAFILIAIEPLFDYLVTLSWEWKGLVQVGFRILQGCVTLGAIWARVTVQRKFENAEK